MNYHYNIMSYMLPMFECSACGRVVAHLYAPYYNFTAKLVRTLSTTEPTSAGLKGLVDGLRDEDYEYEIADEKLSIAPFLRTYYSWVSEDPTRLEFFDPGNIVSRALLLIKDALLPTDLPFGRLNPDMQRNQFDAGVCCLRMFQCDPSTQIM